MNLYIPDSLLARQNPLVKLAILVIISITVLFVFDPWKMFGVLVIAVNGVYLTSGLSVRRMLFTMVPFMVFGFGVVAINAVTRPGDIIFEWMFIAASKQGLLIGVAFALRALVLGLLSVAFVASTAASQLMTALVQYLRLNPRYAYAFMAGHRLVDAMPQQWATIRAAHAVRAPLRRDGNPKFTVGDFGRCAFALLVSSIRASERISMSLESRGLHAGQRSFWKPVSVAAHDFVFGLVTLFLFVAALVLIR